MQRSLMPLPTRSPGGAVLLEVLLALMIFAMVAALFSGTFGRAFRTVAQMDRQARAEDLAVTVFSWLQMGLVQPADTDPVPFEPPLERWTWQVTVSQPDGGPSDPALCAVTVRIAEQEAGLAVQYSGWLYRPERAVPMAWQKTAPADRSGRERGAS